MATVTTPTRREAGSSFAANDALELLPDVVLDELTDAIDAFEPLTPLELVLSDWESVPTDPVLIPVIEPPTPSLDGVKQEKCMNDPTPATDRPGSDPNLKPVTAASPDERNTKPSGPPARPPMKNPSRERLRAELRYLRQRVVEMESELETAKQRQQQLLTRKRPTVQWDQVAQDELRKRQRAEEVNRQLCSALTKQTRVARSLERLLLDHNGAEAFARFCDTTTSPLAVEETAMEDEEQVFTRLEAEVARAYSSVDRVLSECNMHDAQVLYTTSQTDVKTMAPRNGSDAPELVLELLESKFVPFDFTRTCDAFWRAMATAAVYQHHDVEQLVEAGNTIRFKYRVPWHFNGEQRTLRALMVLKQYRTASRMVIAWRGVMATEQSSMRAPWIAAGWEETGWIVVREIDTATAETERPCVLQHISRQVPRWMSASSADRAAAENEIGAFSSMVLSTAAQDIAQITSAMQNLLLAEVLDGVSAAAANEP